MLMEPRANLKLSRIPVRQVPIMAHNGLLPEGGFGGQSGMRLVNTAASGRINIPLCQKVATRAIQPTWESPDDPFLPSENYFVGAVAITIAPGPLPSLFERAVCHVVRGDDLDHVSIDGEPAPLGTFNTKLPRIRPTIAVRPSEDRGCLPTYVSLCECI